MSKDSLEGKIESKIAEEAKKISSNSSIVDIKTATSHTKGWANIVQKVVYAISSNNKVINWTDEDNYFMETWEGDSKAHEFTSDIYKTLTQGHEGEYAGHAIELRSNGSSLDGVEEFLRSLDVAISGETTEGM